MDDNQYLNDQNPIEYNEELSTINAPIEYKLHWLLRYCYKLQNTNTLLDDELRHLQNLWDNLERKSYRNQELESQNAELRKTIKQLHDSNNQLTMKLLSKRK